MKLQKNRRTRSSKAGSRRPTRKLTKAPTYLLQLFPPRPFQLTVLLLPSQNAYLSGNGANGGYASKERDVTSRQRWQANGHPALTHLRHQLFRVVVCQLAIPFFLPLLLVLFYFLRTEKSGDAARPTETDSAAAGQNARRELPHTHCPKSCSRGNATGSSEKRTHLFTLLFPQLVRGVQALLVLAHGERALVLTCGP